jgi:benzodiazapine receptor
MNGSWLALTNAGLLLLQALINGIYVKSFVAVAREQETLITPASFAFAMWIVVYALELVFVAVDLFVPQLSMFTDANQPMKLRLCFAMTCVLNTAWVLLMATRHTYAATVFIYLLWVFILVLYIYAVNERNARGGDSDWGSYLCNEFPMSVYLAWVTCVAFMHLAMALQVADNSYLRLTTYAALLGTVIVLALVTASYAQDPVFSLVVIWYLIAVSVKHVQLPSDIECTDVGVRTCAGEGAAIIAVMLIISLFQMLIEDRWASPCRQALNACMGL